MYQEMNDELESRTSPTHGDARNADNAGGPSAENIFVGRPATPANAVEEWYKQIDLCTTWPGCNDDNMLHEETGYFTAMVWSKAYAVACTKNLYENILWCRFG